jgi:hypothetical protein
MQTTQPRGRCTRRYIRELQELRGKDAQGGKRLLDFAASFRLYSKDFLGRI